MKKEKIITITIGIPTFNSEANIKNLVASLRNQKQKNFILESIIVHDDASSDETVKIIKSINDNKIELIESKDRKGFGNGVKKMMKINTSDFLILLNDDIKIESDTFLSILVSSFTSENNVGLVSGNPQPLKPENFIQNAGVSTFRAYERSRYRVNNGNNKHTCDGKVLGFSKKFIQSIKFPSNYDDLGNVDAYLYFLCIKNGFKYLHAKNAIVYFSFPSTLRDYIRWNTRNNMNQYILEKQFGSIVNQEYSFPSKSFNTSLFIELIKNPVGGLFIFLVGRYCKYKAKRNYQTFNSTWDVITSTKRRLV